MRSGYNPIAKEVALIKIIRRFAETVSDAGSEYMPSVIANYCYELAREYNQFYHDFSILGDPDPAAKNFRLVMSEVTSRVLLTGMWLLGIDMPERM